MPTTPRQIRLGEDDGEEFMAVLRLGQAATFLRRMTGTVEFTTPNGPSLECQPCWGITRFVDLPWRIRKRASRAAVWDD